MGRTAIDPLLPALPPPSGGRGAGTAYRPWQGPVRLLLSLLLLACLVWLMGQESQRPWQDRDRVHITANDQHYRLSRQDLGELQRFSQDYFRDRTIQGQASLTATTEAHLDRLFDRVEGQIPDFLDWYYSMRGEYSRMGMGLFSLLGWHEGDFVRDKAEQMLFHDSRWEASMMRLEVEARAALAQHDASTREGWMAGVIERLAPHEVPAPIHASSRDHSERPRLSLDALQQDMAAASLLSMNERLSLSSGGALAGVVLWRGAARGAAALSGRRIAARGAARGAARAGTGAATGAMVCAPGGPLALTCAVAAGTVAWLGLDWALLKGEEALGRDAMEAALKDSLGELRQEVEGSLQGALATDLTRHQQQLQARVSGHFLPLQGPVMVGE